MRYFVCSRMGRLGALRRLGLGLGLLGALLIGVGGHAAVAAELKVSAWNIAWLTLRPTGDPELPRDVPQRSPADYDLLRGYAQKLNADVVALQEVDGPEAAARIFDPKEYVFHFSDESDVQRTGFAIRRGVAFKPLPDLAALDVRPNARFTQRRGAAIEVQTERGPVVMLSVHLAAGCREGPITAQRGRGCESLAMQVPVLQGWVAAQQRAGVAYMVMGDFNRRIANARDPLLQALDEAGPLTLADQGFSDPCWGPHPFITHIFLGGPARQWVAQNSLRVMVYKETDRSYRDRLSDHCPMSLNLQ